MSSNVKHQIPSIPSLAGSIPKSPSKQECIDKIKELADSFPEQRITRSFFRNKTYWLDSTWTAHFGTFSEFVRQSGLEHTRNANKIRLQTAKHVSQESLKEIGEKRKNYGNLYKRENKKRFQTMIACSDLHDVECDPFYLRVLNNTIAMVDPDIICLNGDIFDLPEFSRHPKDPREWDTTGRLEEGLAIIEGFRIRAPEAQIDFIEGNHEARVIKHMMDADPAMMSLLGDFHGLSVQKLFKLDRYEVNYIADADLHAFTDAQLRKEVRKNFKIYWNAVLAHHFPQGKEKGLPGFNGHHHQHLVWTQHNATLGSYEWHQMGGGHKREAVYCEGSKWNNGFLIVNCDTYTKSVVFDYCYVGDTFSVAGGTWYYREDQEYYPTLLNELSLR